LTDVANWSIEQIKTFQRDHWNHLGKRLSADGVVGPETKWALALETIHPLRKEMIMRAVHTVALKIVESPIGSNRHPWIDAQLLRCGVAPGSKWCAAAVSYWISVDGLPSIATASVSELIRLLPNVTERMPGDVWAIKKNGISHCGLSIGFDAEEVMSVEGNQNQGCNVTVRPHSDITHWLRTVPAMQYPGICSKDVVRSIRSVV
jgi:hypothetical protein